MDEIARLLGVHKNTVRAWLKAGLSPIDRQRPTLVHGAVLRTFLEGRRARAKCKCPPGHFYCLRCRAPRAPAGRMADYIAITATTGNLLGVCPICERFIYRRISAAKIATMRPYLDIRIPQAGQQLRESVAPSLNCDFNTDPLAA